jgi:hypothetical protein
LNTNTSSSTETPTTIAISIGSFCLTRSAKAVVPALGPPTYAPGSARSLPARSSVALSCSDVRGNATTSAACPSALTRGGVTDATSGYFWIWAASASIFDAGDTATTSGAS